MLGYISMSLLWAQFWHEPELLGSDGEGDIFGLSLRGGSRMGPYSNESSGDSRGRGRRRSVESVKAIAGELKVEGDSCDLPEPM